jgi:hypothetical protein
MSEDEKKEKEKRKSFKEFDPTKYVDVEPTLDEAAKGTAVISFGRMNPVTSGHERLVNKVLAVAAQAKGTPLIYLSHSEDTRKNPLSYNDKIKFAKQAFGSVIQKSKSRTIIEVAKELSGKYANLIVVVGSDRVAEFNSLLSKYNGKEYNFQVIDIQTAGARDPDSEGVEGISASKMRSYAADNDLNQFKKGLPKRLQRNADEVMNAVRQGMNINETLEMDDSELNEVLDRQQRRAKAIAMRRVKHKLKRGREKMKRKKATTEILKKRATKKAIATFKDKFSKNKRYADMDVAQKIQIDKKIEKLGKARIERIAKKLLPKVKAAERDKFKKKAIDNPLTQKQESYEINEKIKVAQDRDIDDMPGSQPAGYYKGVDKDKKDDRARHFARKAKMDDDNPKAYTPAPGDKEAKTKPSTFTKKYKAMYGEMNEWVCGQCNCDPCTCDSDLLEMWGSYVTKRPHMLMDRNNKVKYDKRFKMYKPAHKPEDDAAIEDDTIEESVFSEISNLEELLDLVESTEEMFGNLEEKQIEGLKNKADKSGMPYGILKKVYDRGMAAWRTGHRPGTTPQQWGMARVNSFVTKSKGTWGKADSDLAAKIRKEGIEEMNEAATPQMKKAASEIEAYAKKSGGIDKADFMKAAKMLSTGKAGSSFIKFVMDLDTEPREWLIVTLAKHMGKETVEKMFRIKIREEVELDETLSPSEKKLVNQMYDKKGNLTAIGKKVMNHGKKPGDKGYVESIDEMFPAVAAIAGRAVAGAAARAIAKKKKDEASEYEKTRRKTIKSVESFKQFREEGGAGEEGTDELVKNFKKDTPNA